MDKLLPIKVIFFTAVLSAPAHAERSNDHDHSSSTFFESGFVTGIAKEREVEPTYDEEFTQEEVSHTDEQPRDTLSIIKEAQLKAAEKRKEYNPASDHRAQMRLERFFKKSEEETEISSGDYKFKTIGLIVDGSRRTHAQKYIDKLARFSKKAHARIDNIYLIGDGYKALKESGALKDVIPQFPLIHRLNAVPPQYAIKRSPTWIFGFPEGEVLVEGLDNPFGDAAGLRNILQSDPS